MWVFVEGGKLAVREPAEKPLLRDKNRQQTQPTYGVNSENQTWATSVLSECSHHCTILTPLKKVQAVVIMLALGLTGCGER